MPFGRVRHCGGEGGNVLVYPPPKPARQSSTLLKKPRHISTLQCRPFLCKTLIRRAIYPPKRPSAEPKSSGGLEFVVLMGGESQGGIKFRRRGFETAAHYERPRNRLPYWRSPFAGPW
jgi:hypothetical protein